MAARTGLRKKDKKKEAVPEMSTLLNNRDYLGAITLIEFERKMFMDKKQASGWHDAGNGNYQWVEGGKAQLTHDEARQDAERVMWLAYAAFHAGNLGVDLGIRSHTASFLEILSAGPLLYF